jgi:hypothetical protein
LHNARERAPVGGVPLEGVDALLGVRRKEQAAVYQLAEDLMGLDGLGAE